MALLNQNSLLATTGPFAGIPPRTPSVHNTVPASLMALTCWLEPPSATKMMFEFVGHTATASGLANVLIVLTSVGVVDRLV